jgi:tetratricopeptide (TPR) repeat protein
VEWGHRRIRQLLRKLAAPGDVGADELAQSLKRVSGAASAREAVLSVAARALAGYPEVYATIVRRVDVEGESAKSVAHQLHLSERTFFRYRGAAITAIANEIETAAGTATPRAVVDVDLDALALYARGRYASRDRTHVSLQRAMSYFQRALDLDPNFARAHAGIADVHVTLGDSLLRDPQRAFSDAHAALDRAFALDAKLAEAHTTLADLFLFECRDRRRAREELDIALAIDPNYTAALHFRAWLALTEMDADGALAHVRAALARDPESLELQTTLGLALCIKGLAERGIAHLAEIVELNPTFSFARLQLARALAQLERYDESLVHLEVLVEAERRVSFDASIAYVEALAGRPARARRYLREGHPGIRRNNYLRAWLHAVLDEQTEAIDALRAALRAGEPWSVWIGVDSFLTPLRGDPRFHALLEESNQPLPAAAARAS